VISIVLPTLTARREVGWTDRCLNAYRETTKGVEIEFHVYIDRPACGIAWNEGIAEAKGDYIHLSADDITPLPGWWQPAIKSVKQGQLPSARILNSDGSLQSCGTDDQEHADGEEAFVARIPFASREQFQRIGPMMDEQYMGDYWFSHQGRAVGYPSIVVREYAFVHHYAQEGRIDTLAVDVIAYHAKGGL
jgi:GT2 family glycosyltransferase